jgi:hypothetical protein
LCWTRLLLLMEELPLFSTASTSDMPSFANPPPRQSQSSHAPPSHMGPPVIPSGRPVSRTHVVDSFQHQRQQELARGSPSSGRQSDPHYHTTGRHAVSRSVDVGSPGRGGGGGGAGDVQVEFDRMMVSERRCSLLAMCWGYGWHSPRWATPARGRLVLGVALARARSLVQHVYARSTPFPPLSPIFSPRMSSKSRRLCA